MIGTNGRVTNYADIDELTATYGRSLPEETTIQDMIRRVQNGITKQKNSNTFDEAGRH